MYMYEIQLGLIGVIWWYVGERKREGKRGRERGEEGESGGEGGGRERKVPYRIQV